MTASLDKIPVTWPWVTLTRCWWPLKLPLQGQEVEELVVVERPIFVVVVAPQEVHYSTLQWIILTMLPSAWSSSYFAGVADT